MDADEHKGVGRSACPGDEAGPRRSTSLGGLLLVFLLAALIRGGALWFAPGALTTDPDDYRRLANNLVRYDTFGRETTPTAYRPPLYPLLLTGCRERWAVGLLHVAMGAATAAIAFLLGRCWGLHRRGAMLAAMLVACDPILLNQSTQVMTETLAALLAAVALLTLTWLDRRETLFWAWAAGVVLGLAALCRPTFLAWAAVLGAWWLWRGRRDGTQFRIAAIFGVGLLIALSPWAIRNGREFGRPIVTTTHGGFTMLLANNPEFYEWLREGRWGDVWRADRFNAEWAARRPTDEWQADRLAYSEAWRTIRREPGTFVYACLVRVGRFWSPLPHGTTADESTRHRAARWGVAVWYSAELLAAIVGLWLLAKRKAMGRVWILGLLMAACFAAAHTLYWTDMRMRGPLTTWIALAAASTVGAIDAVKGSQKAPAKETDPQASDR
ncbi:MAG: glycosyltransferase family 39 protein [Planctomycetaceae bacterium]|nr:glycosyltransferase family 39 protein [Planctomycetaceae bacterium]